MVAVFAHLLSEVLTKHIIKETSSKGNIRGPFYIPEGEVPGGGERIRKYYVMKNIYINPNPKKIQEFTVIAMSTHYRMFF